MSRYEAIAEKAVWGVSTIFVVLIVSFMALSALDAWYPNLLKRDPIPERQAERQVFMPPLEDIKLVLDRDEVRNPGDRVKNALKECIGSPPALFGMGGDSRIEEFLADATEKDVFFFYCASREVWETLAGRAGYVKIREGKPVDELTLVMN